MSDIRTNKELKILFQILNENILADAPDIILLDKINNIRTKIKLLRDAQDDYYKKHPICSICGSKNVEVKNINNNGTYIIHKCKDCKNEDKYYEVK